MKLPRLTQRVKAVLVVAILVVTTGAFIHYFSTHPDQFRQLGQLSPLLLAGLLGLYACFLLSMVYILYAQMAAVKVRIPWLENFTLTSYSTIVNFFGPLQSGPGVRLVYLKQKHGVSVKKFMFGTFLYYGFFALFSGILVSFRALPWWLTVPFLAGIAGLSFIVIKKKGSQANLGHIDPSAIVNLALATFVQVMIVTTLYFTELHSINPDITFGQAMTYTGAANFALFVSLTPGAIGFRESFLLFTQKLHGIDPSQVLSASLIDRATNVTFLGLLFLITLALHAKERINRKQLAAQESADE